MACSLFHVVALTNQLSHKIDLHVFLVGSTTEAGINISVYVQQFESVHIGLAG